MEINWVFVGIIASIYLIVLPIIFRLVAYLQRKMLVDHRAQRLRAKGADRQALKHLPKPIWPKWREHLGWTWKDERTFTLGKDKETGEPKTLNVTRKAMLKYLWLLGLVITVVGAIIFNWWVIAVGMLTFFITMGYGIISAKPILAERKRLFERMAKIGSKSFHYPAEDMENPQSVVKVLEWDDYVTPSKVQFHVPDTFGQEGEEAFMRQFNQIFGTIRTWVPSYDEENEEYGWDYDKGLLTIYAVPPLPQRAPWHERYVLSPEIAWSFFPVALGVENGVELTNPETGDVENVLGFDLAGEQLKVGEQHGVRVAPHIVASPMALVAGGTGGGKALAADTMVYVVDEDAVDEYKAAQRPTLPTALPEVPEL